MTLLARLAAGLILCGVAGWLPAQTKPTAEIDNAIRQGDSLLEQGRNDEARRVYESVLRTLRERPPSPQLGYVLNAMNQVEIGDGNYELAAKLAQESADVYHGLGDSRGEAHAYNNKGLVEIQRGAYAVADVNLQKALELARRARDLENQVQILNNLGSASFFQGKYYEALREYQDAMKIVEQASDAKWAAYWRPITSFNQATLYQRLGRYQKALQIYRDVQASSTTLTPGDRAHLLANLGTLYRRLGDPWKALASYGSAQKLYSTAHDADGEISVLKNIGIVHALNLGDLTQAERIFRRVELLAARTHNRREEMQAHLYLGEALLRAGSLSQSRSEFETARSLATELGTEEEQWKALYGLGRLATKRDEAESAYRQAIAIIEKSRAQLQLSALRAEFLADKRDVYDALIGILLARNDVPGAFSLLERSRARTFQDRVAGPAAGGSEFRALSLDEARSHLDPATVLFEFWTAGDRVALIWCKRDAYGVAVKEFTAEQRDRISSVPDNLAGASLADFQQPLRELGDLFPPQSAAFWSGIRHLLIVPDGWLSVIPFDLVSTSSRGQDSLIERFDIAYLPSAILLRRAPRTAGWANFPWTRELVAFGDPIVQQDVLSGGSSVDRETPSSLPGSVVEVRGIARMAHGTSELFLGENDLKKHFLAKANSAFILHVSTHAFADGSNPEDSRMLFTSDDPKAPADYVFLRELYGVNLDNLRLATISACDTERGTIIRGEGVQAFSRALLSAGARSSLTTLWRVDDAATAEFMKQFYFFALEQGKPTAEALRLAKLRFFRSHSALANPRYWAAFVLNGDGLMPLPTVISWRQIAIVSFAVLILPPLGLAWLLLRNRRRIDR